MFDFEFVRVVRFWAGKKSSDLLLLASFGHGDGHAVVVAGQLSLVLELLVPQQVLGQQLLADVRQDEEDDAAADDEADHQHPVLPSHRNDAESRDLGRRTIESILIESACQLHEVKTTPALTTFIKV